MEREIDQIKAAVLEMWGLVERALRNAVESVVRRDRQLALSVILRDGLIDEQEQELNRRCLEFLVRHQPVARPLRLAYAAIRISQELERIGDHAESIARSAQRLATTDTAVPDDRYREMVELTAAMLRDAVHSFVTEDADLARRTEEVEETVDNLKSDLAQELRLAHPRFESLDPLLQIGRRLDRSSNLARDICHDVIFMCTGRPAAHKAHGTVRILFVDDHNGCLSKMAEAIGASLGKSKVVFASAGLDPHSLDATTIAFMKQKGMDLSRTPARALHEVPDLDQFQVVVALSNQVKRAFPPRPRKLVYLEWEHHPPDRTVGSPEAVMAAYEAAYDRLRADVCDLVDTINTD